ncbi:MAG: 4Fe-4S binding protein [Candidatus Binatia bacterium]
MSIRVDATTCTGCGSCVLTCLDGAIDTRPEFTARIDASLCTDCLLCLDYCPSDSLIAE